MRAEKKHWLTQMAAMALQRGTATGTSAVSGTESFFDGLAGQSIMHGKLIACQLIGFESGQPDDLMPSNASQIKQW
jgi:hypothetical protein